MSNTPLSLWSVENGRLCLRLHPGQARSYRSQKRFSFILAGAQSGKTSYLPWLLLKQISETAAIEGGSNDYIAITSSYDLFKLKFLPEIRNTFETVTKSGRYWSGDRVIELRDPRTKQFWAKRSDDPMWGRIILRSASSGGGLESTSARGCIMDECGQAEFTVETWEAILRRLSLYQGRVDAGTTLYDIGWLKTEVWDRFQRVGTPGEQPGDDDFDVINFDSTENPAFPLAEFERARNSMPEWRFNMFYRGRFTRPAGQIYDCFLDKDISEGGHRMRPRKFTGNEQEIAGGDFGVVNTCFGIYVVEEDREGYPTGRLILRRTYHAGARNATEHVEKLREIAPKLSIVVGGAPSEDQWRQAYLWAGLPIYAPTVTDVEVGIDGVYGATKADKILVFDTEQTYIKQKKEYSRELDDRGEPTVKIKNKEKYHHLDQERYLVSLACPRKTFLPFVPRKHLIVNFFPRQKWWNRFAGMRFREGQPAAFVLCAMDDIGRVIVEGEVSAPGLVPGQFLEQVLSMLRARKVSHEKLLVACNPEMFVNGLSTTGIVGEAQIEIFRKAGFRCAQTDADGINDWVTLKERMTRPDGIRVQKTFCPFLWLSMGMIVADVKAPDKPDKRGPISAAQALCYALMLRPRNAKQPGKPGVDPADQSHLPHELQTTQEVTHYE